MSPAPSHLANAAASLLAMALFALPLAAQRTAPAPPPPPVNRGGSPPSSAGPPSMPSIYGPQPFPDIPQPRRPYMPPEDEDCLPWAVPEARSATVSVMKLQVPSKARGEYERSCSAFKRKQYQQAEQHARNAIEKFQDYEAAWVMLGEALEEQRRVPEAREACAHVSAADPRYLDAYLCSADLAARSEQWQELLDFANLAAGLNPVGDVYAGYYRALAYFHLQNLLDARHTAEQAANEDRDHTAYRNASLYFLLAQIYDAQNDRADAIAQLHLFLKLNKDSEKAAAAQQLLARLESQPK